MLRIKFKNIVQEYGCAGVDAAVQKLSVAVCEERGHEWGSHPEVEHLCLYCLAECPSCGKETP
ncbi:hypothetical protein LCGC14_0728260 [marine sediment metagenome]|uniref:Uncharacterized protein n=1 Tax=marine sediment metagenome TaxID=412755 RepID=A0A0F9SVM7_9ZZZZ